MKKTDQGKTRIEEADRRGDKYFEMLGEKLAEEEQGGKRAKVKKQKGEDEVSQGVAPSLFCISLPLSLLVSLASLPF